jgi:hypothetical protein
MGVERIKAAPLIASTALIAVISAFHLKFTVDAIPSCPYKSLTGSDCPGCGTGRALAELSHLNISKAFDQNALSTTLILGLIWYGLGTGLSIFQLPDLRSGKLTSIYTPISVVAIFLIFWLARIAHWPLGEYLASGIYSK